MAALEQVFELDAAFNDGQLSVYRSGRPVDELMDGMRQAAQDAAAGNTVTDDELRETVLDEDDTSTDDEPEGMVSTERSDEDASGSDAESEPPCQYCGDTFDPRGLKRHEQRCDENPDNIADDSEDEENADEVMCEHCGDSFPRRGLGPHQRFCEDNPANADDESEDDNREEDASDDDAAADTNDGSVATDGGGLVSKKPAAIREAMENPDDLPDEPVPVGVAIQYNAGSYTCKSCDTCLNSDKELTEHVNEEGHRGAFQVNRRGCQ